MGILKIKQIAKNGSVKNWKIDSKAEQLTFGTSRKADLVSIDPSHSPIQGVLQFKNNKWSFSQFDLNNQYPQKYIDGSCEVPFENSELRFEVIQMNDFVTQSLEKKSFSGSTKKKILLVTRENRLLKTEVKDINEPFYYSINGQKHKLSFVGSDQWENQYIEGFEFKSKFIHIDDLKDLSKIQTSQLIDKDSKKIVYLSLFAILSLMTIGLLTPKKDLQVVEKLNLPESMVVKIEPKKEREKKKAQQANAQQAQKLQQVAQTKTPETSASAASPAKVKALLKGSIGARISQLIGKVSATDARTANVIAAAQGIKAGNGPSGRALSAVGNVESSGRNWTGEAVGNANGKVGTAGIGGGRGIAGLGNSLAAGKTGSGGVGLLEDESEIEGGLDREIIAQYIKSQLGQILYCYERQLSATPDIYGKVAVKFTISGSGQVVAQNIGDTTLKSAPVEGCILNKVSKWKFPEPKGGTKVVVTYPFLFKSTN